MAQKLFEIKAADVMNPGVSVFITVDDSREYTRETAYHITLAYDGDRLRHTTTESQFLDMMLAGLKPGQFMNDNTAECILQYILCEVYGDHMNYNRVMCIRKEDGNDAFNDMFYNG